MENIPYTVLVHADTQDTLDATVPALARLGVSTHTLDALPSHADIATQLHILSGDVGYYSVIGALDSQIRDEYVHTDYTVGISSTQQGLTVRGIRQFSSRVDVLGSVPDRKQLGWLIVRTLHPHFLAEARLHRKHQRHVA